MSGTTLEPSVIVHRLTNANGWEDVMRLLESNPLRYANKGYGEQVAKMPEDLSFFRKYLGDSTGTEQTVGVLRIPELKWRQLKSGHHETRRCIV